MLRILAVDDDPDALRLLQGTLERDHAVSACSSGAEAARRLAGERWDLLVADLNMPPPDGFDLLRAAQALTPPLPVIVISAMDRARTTLEAMRLGARDYLVKPASPEEIRAAVGQLADVAETGESRDVHGLVGGSAALRDVRRLIPLLARSNEMVLVQGETGTGKELFARALHDAGHRLQGPFVAHNMAATPSELAESLFFGHVRGSFSGASTDHAGLFEQADGGTLYLDEVDSFPLALQAKLLRVLETRRVQRLGSGAERNVDVRVVSSSAADLEERVAQSAFRADLYFRLRQLEVTMPPLRARMEDVPALARHFLAELAPELGRTPPLSEAAMRVLQAHSWPGNCRELRNAVRSAALMCADGPILPGHLPRSLQAGERAGPAPDSGSALREIEREHILRVLERAQGNRSRAARLLGIDRGTLARKLRSLGLDRERPA